MNTQYQSICASVLPDRLGYHSPAKSVSRLKRGCQPWCLGRWFRRHREAPREPHSIRLWTTTVGWAWVSRHRIVSTWASADAGSSLGKNSNVRAMDRHSLSSDSPSALKHPKA